MLLLLILTLTKAQAEFIVSAAQDDNTTKTTANQNQINDNNNDLTTIGNSIIISQNDNNSLTLEAIANNTANNNSDLEPVYMQHLKLILVILHLSVFITGLVGNSLVCLSVFRNKSLQTVTNYYIVNLAVADFLVILICLPPTVYWDLYLTWSFGQILCKLVLYLQVSSL